MDEGAIRPASARTCQDRSQQHSAGVTRPASLLYREMKRECITIYLLLQCASPNAESLSSSHIGTKLSASEMLDTIRLQCAWRLHRRFPARHKVLLGSGVRAWTDAS